MHCYVDWPECSFGTLYKGNPGKDDLGYYVRE